MRSKRAVLLAVLAFCLLIQAGCRDSPALTTVVYNQDCEDVSPEDAMKDNDLGHAELDDTIFSLAEEDSAEQERGWENSQAQYGAEDSAQEAARTEYSETAGDLYEGAQSIGDETEDAAGGENPGEIRAEDGTVSAEAGGLITLPVEGVGQLTDQALKQLVLPDGSQVEVPENLGTAAAVGQAAVLVQMLGGAGALAATSADFLENEWVQTVFGDEGASSVPVLWSGDGSAGLDETAFARLLELCPGVCFEISGQMTFTDAQLARLAEAGISYVTLPALTSASGIRSAAAIVGQVLGDRSGSGGQNAPELAQAYLDWYDGLLEEVGRRVSRFTVNRVDYDNVAGGQVRYLEESASSGKYTLYLSNWDSQVEYTLSTISYVEWEEQGLPVAVKGYTDSPVSYYMSLAGVVNQGAAAVNGTDTSLWYVHPISSVAHIKSIRNGAPDVSFNNTNGSQTGYLTAGLGSEQYPALVAASAEIKEALERSALWQRGNWTDQGGIEVVSTIVGDYEIYVNPRGVGSWAEGSAESVLESVWMAWKFQDAFTREEVESCVAEFYSSFYRYELTEEQLAEILAEEI